ncbi:MAG: HEPN domain-containing protein [Candidatus Pacearchaeota archaeon]
MVSKVELYLKRADDELLLSKVNFNMSVKPEIKQFLRLNLNQTFFNDVISEAYYSIFYAAKAYLLTKGIETSAPEEHKKTYNYFKKFVNKGVLDKELLEIYDTEADKAEFLLKIFFKEKSKRGKFVYNINSDANIPVALNSIGNAKKFVANIKSVIEKEK